MSDYCPECIAAIHAMHGGEHADSPEEAAEKIARSEADALVEVAEIEARRDIELAKLSVGMVEQEQEVELAVAEAELEVVSDALEAETAPEETEDSPAVVTVVATGDEQQSDDTELPPADESEPESEPVTESKSRGYGNPGWFGDR
jgi:hypothetical protein